MTTPSSWPAVCAPRSTRWPSARANEQEPTKETNFNANLDCGAGAALHDGGGTSRSTGRLQVVPRRLSGLREGPLAGRMQGQSRHLFEALSEEVTGCARG